MKKISILFSILMLLAMSAAAQITYIIPLGGTANQLLFQTNGVVTNTLVPLASTNGGGYFTTNNCTNVSGVVNLTKAKDVAFQASFVGLTADTTNGLYFVASNSLDSVTWAADPVRNFQLIFNGTTLVAVITNFNSMGGIGYEKFSIRFPGPAGQSASNFVFGYAAKNGL